MKDEIKEVVEEIIEFCADKEFDHALTLFCAPIALIAAHSGEIWKGWTREDSKQAREQICERLKYIIKKIEDYDV